MKLILCITNLCIVVLNFKLWFQYNHIIFLSRDFCSSVLIIIVLRVYFPQWSTGFSTLRSVLSISSSFWVKAHFFSSAFAIILSRVYFCWLSIILWLPVWHQYFCIVNVSSLLRPPLDKRSAFCEVINFKMFFCDDTHCSSSLLFPAINKFLSF